jgi:hypothetical protein
MNAGPPILPALALAHLARAIVGLGEVKAGLAQAAAICDLAAKEGAPRDACVYLDWLLASVGDLNDQVGRLHSLTQHAVMDRRKKPRNGEPPTAAPR